MPRRPCLPRPGPAGAPTNGDHVDARTVGGLTPEELQGEAGPQGPQGPAGADGEPGPTGPQGTVEAVACAEGYIVEIDEQGQATCAEPQTMTARARVTEGGDSYDRHNVDPDHISYNPGSGQYRVGVRVPDGWSCSPSIEVMNASNDPYTPHVAGTSYSDGGALANFYYYLLDDQGNQVQRTSYLTISCGADH